MQEKEALSGATLAEDGNYLPLYFPLGIPLAFRHKDRL